MGGMGSGAQRSKNVGNVEDAIALDIRVLRRLGVVRPGECVIDDVHWSKRGLRTACARLRVDLSDIEHATPALAMDAGFESARRGAEGPLHTAGMTVTIIEYFPSFHVFTSRSSATKNAGVARNRTS